MPYLIESLAILACYLIGSIPFGVIVAKLRGVDIFTAGSGNIGATNVGRVLGRRFGILVLVLDFLKGAVPVFLVSQWRGSVDWIAVAAGLAAVLGHVFPIFARFRGGKGVAVGAGVMAVLLPLPALAAVIAFIASLLPSRMMSLASVVAAAALGIAALSLNPSLVSPPTLLALAGAALVAVRHRSNSSRIRAGSERTLTGFDRIDRIVPGLHAVAIGLWCGAGWFFTLGVAGKVFASFDALVQSRPDWLSIFGNANEFGSRLAAVAVTPMFPVYFGLQAICGLVAAGTALGWCAVTSGWVHRIRAILLCSALLLVAAGWPVAQHVADLRVQRYSPDATVMERARAEFTRWHLYSIFLNLGVLGCTLPALALAAYPRKKELSLEA